MKKTVIMSRSCHPTFFSRFFLYFYPENKILMLWIISKLLFFSLFFASFWRTVYVTRSRWWWCRFEPHSYTLSLVSILILINIHKISPLSCFRVKFFISHLREVGQEWKKTSQKVLPIYKGGRLVSKSLVLYWISGLNCALYFTSYIQG